MSDRKNIWQNLPWKEAEIGSADLADLPCRLEGFSLSLALKKIWQICADEAIVKFRLPHPRHDVFLADLGYVRALLPETFSQLDPRQSTTGLATRLGVRFEIVEVAFSLDPHWQKAIDEQKLAYDDIQLISRQASNVIEWIGIQLQVKKSLWVQSSAPPLTAEMKDQLLEQIKAHEDRGDHQAAAVIRQFLANQDSNEGSTK